MFLLIFSRNFSEEISKFGKKIRQAFQNCVQSVQRNVFRISMFRIEKTVYFPLSWILKRNWFGILCQIFQKESSVNFACRLKRFSQETVIFWIKNFCILFLKDTRIESTFWWKKLGRIAETEFFGARRIFFGKSFFFGKNLFFLSFKDFDGKNAICR